MFNVKCKEKDCEQNNVERTFLGEQHTVRCGSCATSLQPYNQQPDPEPETI